MPIIPELFAERIELSDGGHVDVLANAGEPEKMADAPTPAEPSAQLGSVPVTAQSGTDGKPASDEVALAGKDGKALARLIRGVKAEGVRRFGDIVGEAVKNYAGHGPLLNPDQQREIADSLAAVSAVAELMGRTRVREMAERTAGGNGLHKFADGDDPLSKLTVDPLKTIQTPEEAYSYFASLVPKMGVDPERFATEQRRRAFTLAASTNDVLTSRVQGAIAASLKEHDGTADATARLTRLLDAAGCSSSNPQYSEMVFRTNAMDSYQTGAYEEGQHPDVADVFPAWEYLGIDDDRAGDDHRPKFGKLYPPTATFAAVRGNRPFNCRCSLRWVDKYEFADRSAAGERIEVRW